MIEIGFSPVSSRGGQTEYGTTSSFQGRGKRLGGLVGPNKRLLYSMRVHLYNQHPVRQRGGYTPTGWYLIVPEHLRYGSGLAASSHTQRNMRKKKYRKCYRVADAPVTQVVHVVDQWQRGDADLSNIKLVFHFDGL